ncbi:M20/M25/M40 family metallo-hydrolase [Streptomyces zaomyceticus]|uniref:M20/M25/M40 family metallo-hydrolase n=1 Tax=Streptomyces zaomyceticus TaxID=68286 RepID=UPI003687240D
MDTAPYGDLTCWSFAPTSGDIRDGWLLGRGAADSKLAAAMYCHIAADLAAHSDTFAGGLAVLLDVDEHTGNFSGARAYLDDPQAVLPAGVIIGYPGMDEVIVGGRGLWRAAIAVHAPSGHSGSSRTVTGAITRPARLVGLLDAAELPGPDCLVVRHRLQTESFPALFQIGDQLLHLVIRKAAEQN